MKNRKQVIKWIGTFLCVVIAFLFGASGMRVNFSQFSSSSAAECVTESENDKLFDAYAESVLFEENFSNRPRTVAAKSQLSGVSLKLFEALESLILSLASGSRSDASITFDKTTLESWGAKLSWTKGELGLSKIEHVDEVTPSFYAQFGISNVIEALMSDHPFELYWFDKTVGYLMHSSVAIVVPSGSSASIEEFEMMFSVAEGYRASGYVPSAPAVDTTKALAVQSAAQNAREIVQSHASNSDVHKLRAYAEEICDLVTYNTAAASGGVAYGDPWQIVYVFDKNPSTNVVCEGYAKAFKYLCDLTDFSHAEIECYLASGLMGSEPHMWNIVSLASGLNYLVDVTNSDTGTVGSSGGLFMAGGSGNMSSGFSFVAGGSTIKYVYDNDTKGLWGTASGSVLDISSESYVLENTKIDFVVKQNIVFDGEALLAGVAGAGDFDVAFTTDGDDTNFSYTHSWFLDNSNEIGEALSDAPTNAGSYWIKVRATNNTNSEDYVENQLKVTIEKAAISTTFSYEKVQESGKVFGDTNFTVIATGAADATISGTTRVEKADGTVLSSDTPLEQGVEYHWFFFPSDSVNYPEASGTIIFWKFTFFIEVYADDDAHGSVLGGGEIGSGEMLTVQAIAKRGWKFVRWEVNGETVSTEELYTFVASENVELVAVFEEHAVPDIADKVVEILGYVFYGLCGNAIVAVSWVFTHK
ncbi:MAG: hypothetical protein IJW24_01090, partial [Clostridia bacterium]|nr:hypothetical protein [Clostridia bacterium]